MISKIGFSAVVLACLLGSGVAGAENAGARQDARAIEVLKSMSAYTATLDRLIIGGVSFADARLGGGLMVANSTEVLVTIDRPGSLHVHSFDGVENKELYFHDGLLTVFNAERNFYAQASIPQEIEAAVEFALEELEVEAPLLDLIHRDVSAHLIGSQETILYLTDKARIAGTDCHHIAIRGPETDVQLWVEEGERPLPRKIMLTSKWEGGAPRFISNLVWMTEPDFDASKFEFTAPDGAVNIGFAGHTDGGE